jgi:hypothetical protein
MCREDLKEASRCTILRRGAARGVAAVAPAADRRCTGPTPDLPDVTGRAPGRRARAGHGGRDAARCDALAAPFPGLPPRWLSYLVPTPEAAARPGGSVCVPVCRCLGGGCPVSNRGRRFSRKSRHAPGGVPSGAGAGKNAPPRMRALRSGACLPQGRATQGVYVPGNALLVGHNKVKRKTSRQKLRQSRARFPDGRRRYRTLLPTGDLRRRAQGRVQGHLHS